MSVTWEKWVDAWRQGTNTNDSSLIEAVITQDFKWNTSDFDRQATLDWVNATNFRVACLSKSDVFHLKSCVITASICDESFVFVPCFQASTHFSQVTDI